MGKLKLTAEGIENLDQWWAAKAAKNFLAYRIYIHPKRDQFMHGWFIEQLASVLQQFYVDFKKGKRPIYIVTTPPQHGKSWTVNDFISWVIGLDPSLRIIMSSFSDKLSKRSNLYVQRMMSSDNYAKVFPNTVLPRRASSDVRTTTHLEFIDKETGLTTNGQFRNTTTGGPVTGESLDIGFIDDPVKGREQANNAELSQKTWEWFTDDFYSRFSELGGLLVVMTRWTTHDLAAKLIKHFDGQEGCRIFNFKAIADTDEEFRKAGEPLFPEQKSLEFLRNREKLSIEQSWLSLYQGTPVADGGNLIKDSWWGWWEKTTVAFEFTFAVADTAQKKNNWNDWTVFQFWGFGVDKKIYLLDQFRDRVKAPDLRRESEIFYIKCEKDTRGVFRGFCIEDKSSGVGLIQELEEKQFKVFAVPRAKDKITRAYDTGPEIKAGKVVLNASVSDVGIIKNEAKEFPNGAFDDTFDCTMTAIEVAFIYPEILNHKVFIA